MHKIVLLVKTFQRGYLGHLPRSWDTLDWSMLLRIRTIALGVLRFKYSLKENLTISRTVFLHVLNDINNCVSTKLPLKCALSSVWLPSNAPCISPSVLVVLNHFVLIISS